MKKPPGSDRLLRLAFAACALAVGVWLGLRIFGGIGGAGHGDPSGAGSHEVSTLDSAGLPKEARAVTPDLSNALLDALKERIEQPHARENEALLTFSDADSLAGFVARAKAAGLEVSGPFDGALTIRVSFASLDQLRDALSGHPGEEPRVDANFHVGIPPIGTPPPAGGTGTAPFLASLFPSLGIEPGIDRATWGEGVTVAVIDSGISTHPTFREGQLTHLDLSGESGELNPHGTAMASLVAGAIPGAEGLAPGAKLLDLRIAGADGFSDSFRLARGIHAAIEGGADVINISMASYGDARPVADAVAEALRRGITIVAAVGNDGVGMKAWPAAYSGVISVSGVAADGSLAYFSNTGSPTLAAPSVGVPSAYHDGSSALLATGNGTSQAAALVSGAAAAYLSHGFDLPDALIRNVRPGTAKQAQIGAGILYLPSFDSSRATNR